MAATSALVGVIESAYHHPAWTSSQVPEPGPIQGGPNPELKLQVDQAAGAAQRRCGLLRTEQVASHHTWGANSRGGASRPRCSTNRCAPTSPSAVKSTATGAPCTCSNRTDLEAALYVDLTLHGP